MMRKITGRLSLLAGLALAATSLSAVQAGAAPPDVVSSETRTSVICTGVADNTEVTAEAISYGGTQGSARAQIYDLDRDSGGIGWGESSWGPTTFSSTISVQTSDEEGNDIPLGDVIFSGSFETTGDPVTHTSQFRTGNMWFEERITRTPLAVTVHTLAYDGVPVAIEKCEGDSTTTVVTGSNPRTSLFRYFETPYECEMTNASDYWIYRDEPNILFMEVTGSDGQTTATGPVDFARGSSPWHGTFRINDDMGSETRVPASATVTRLPTPIHDTQDIPGQRNHVQITEYRVQLTVELPEETARLDCRIQDVRFTARVRN